MAICKKCGCNTSKTNMCDECICTNCGLRPIADGGIDDKLCNECTELQYPALFGKCTLCGDHMSTHGFFCDEKKRTDMQIIKGKSITMQDVIESPSSLEETQKFLTHWHLQNYQLTDLIPVEDVILYSKKECLINWLIKIGKLKKVEVFQPFTIEIPVNSPEEYWEVWHRMNMRSLHDMDSYRNHQRKRKDRTKHMSFDNSNSHKLWKYVDQTGRDHGTH
jgi:hypothetical protein